MVIVEFSQVIAIHIDLIGFQASHLFVRNGKRGTHLVYNYTHSLFKLDESSILFSISVSLIYREPYPLQDSI